MPRFEGTLEAARGGGAYVVLPPDVQQELGGRARARVRGTLNGVEFRSNTMAMGGGAVCLGVHKATRAAAGATPGDTVAIDLERDDEPRSIEMPPALAQALDADADARAAFDRLAPTTGASTPRGWPGRSARRPAPAASPRPSLASAASSRARR